MPLQSPLRIIKRWRRYEKRGDWTYLPPLTRGLYVLYKEQNHSISKKLKNKDKIAHVVYIGVAGFGKNNGIGGRLRSHHSDYKKDWTHYSFFEVHDNISSEEIRELETFLLAIFCHDPRIELSNRTHGSQRLRNLRKVSAFPDCTVRPAA
jgi:hypothetical protein